MTEHEWLPAYPGIKYNWVEEATSFDCPCGAKDIVISESGTTVTCFCGRVYQVRHYVEVAVPPSPSESGTPTPRPLKISASGDPDFPFFVSPVDSDGISLPPIAAFEYHADALRFVEGAKVQP